MDDITFPVLDHGFVRIVDIMGDDSAVVQAARVSYGQGTKSVSEDRGLIRYLMRNKHTSPFEMCEIKLHVKMPIFVARQWVRHRTASLNEYSGRYSEMKDEFYVPRLNRIQVQAADNKQGSGEVLGYEVACLIQDTLDDHAQEAFSVYDDFLDYGLSRELARIHLPLNTYTEFYWKIDLHNLLHFLELRCDRHAQWEIRQYADVILHEIVAKWVPHTYEAFVDYRLEAVTFSRQEMLFLRAAIREGIDHIIWSRDHTVSRREAKAFAEALDLPFKELTDEEVQEGIRDGSILTATEEAA